MPTTTLHPVVIRHYDVVLMPDAETAYDPISVTLSLSPADAERIHPTSGAAKREAFDRAVRVERQSHHTPSTRSFLAGEITYKRGRVVMSETRAFDRERKHAKRNARRRNGNGR